MDDLTQTHLQELRRGTVVLASLLSLREPGYGYGLLESLEAIGISVDGNTLYPLLRGRVLTELGETYPEFARQMAADIAGLDMRQAG